MTLNNEDISNNTLIGTGSNVTGNLRINGFLRVDGDVDGDINTNGSIIIGNKARIRGNISGTSAVIGGIVEGNILAPDSVQLLSTSAVIGDIQTHSIQIEQNVIFHGHCISLLNDDEYTTAAQSYHEKEAIRTRADSLFAAEKQGN